MQSEGLLLKCHGYLRAEQGNQRNSFMRHSFHYLNAFYKIRLCLCLITLLMQFSSIDVFSAYLNLSFNWSVYLSGLFGKSLIDEKDAIATLGASAAVGAGGEYGDWALLGFISVVILVGMRAR